MAHVEPADSELSDLLLHLTGIDLAALPPVMKTEQLAAVLGTTPAALAQDRYRRTGIPYTKIQRRVRYLRIDVARYLVTHRTGGDDVA